MANNQMKGGLAPGTYLLNVRQAALQLAAGKLAGTCKSCGREFRIPTDIAKWPLFLRDMIAHPLEHDHREDTKRSVERRLLVLDDVNLVGEAENKLAHAFLVNIDKLAEGGALTKVSSEDGLKGRDGTVAIERDDNGSSN